MAAPEEKDMQEQEAQETTASVTDEVVADEVVAEEEAAPVAEAEAEAADDAAEVAAEEAADEPVAKASGPGDLNLGQERVLEFLSYVMVNLVEHPEDVTIDLVRRDDRDVYKVRVHEEDLGKVIGKGGQTARALRVMLTALSSRTDQKIGLDIVE